MLPRRESYQWRVDKGYLQWWERDMLDTENCEWATDPYNCCRTHDGCCRPPAASPDNISPLSNEIKYHFRWNYEASK